VLLEICRVADCARKNSTSTQVTAVSWRTDKNCADSSAARATRQKNQNYRNSGSFPIRRVHCKVANEARMNASLPPNGPVESHIVQISDDAKKRIDILFKEYDTLRQETIMRMNQRLSMTNVFTGLAVFVVAVKPADMLPMYVGVPWAIILLIIWVRTAQLLNNLRRRLVLVEIRVNELAGEKLLAWETSYAQRAFLRYFSGSAKQQ
jgi:hypothetical protein